MLSAEEHKRSLVAIKNYRLWQTKTGSTNVCRARLRPFMCQQNLEKLFDSLAQTKVNAQSLLRSIERNSFCVCCNRLPTSIGNQLCPKCVGTASGRVASNAAKLAKTRVTNMRKYGVPCVFANQEVKERIAEVMLDRYGVTNPSKSEMFKQKKLDTHHRNHGDVPYSQGRNAVAKRRDTAIRKWGVPHMWLNPSIKSQAMSNSLRSRFKDKPVTYRKRIWICQGYEPQVLNRLLRHFKASDITAHTMQTHKGISPGHQSFSLGGHKNYFPDFYVKSINTFVEVKSVFTLMRGNNKDQLRVNKKKSEWARNQGVNLVFVVYCARRDVCKVLPRQWDLMTARQIWSVLNDAGMYLK